MKKALVKFSVGVKHPLYNKYVEAEILHENCGYDGQQIIAKTLDNVLHEEDKEGILVYKKDKFAGYKTRSAFSEKYEGYVEDVK